MTAQTADEIDGDVPEEDTSVGGELPAEADGKRLDAALALAIPDLSRSRLKELILSGRIALAGQPVLDPSRKVRAGETFAAVLPPPEPAAPEAEDIPLTIVFEDEHLLVVDKPAGLVVHPGNGHQRGTLVNALIHHCGASLSGIGGVRRPGIVHRLDRDTSGLMVVAKHDRAHRHLSAQFADHGRTGPLTRAYRAVVWGAPQTRYGTIETGLARSNKDRLKMAVTRVGGRQAITHYEIDETFPTEGATEASLIACVLETGRTHQIRVHMSHIGHPLIGDPDYGSHFRTKLNRLPEAVRAIVASFPRQALHAVHLGFEHPLSGRQMAFDSEPPADMARLIEALRTL